MATKRQAAKGGEIGANGAFYKGGRFINENPANPFQHCIACKPASTKKVEIAPYKYDYANEGKTPIWAQIQSIAKFNETSFKSGIWLCDRSTIKHEALEYYRISLERYLELVDLFESGERWV